MPSKRKKNEVRKSKKEGRRESEKLKVNTAVPLLRNFAFCACPNFASRYFATGSEGCEVYDLQTALW